MAFQFNKPSPGLQETHPEPSAPSPRRKTQPRISSGGMLPKRRAFVEHYKRMKNATQAAIAAGYSKKTAKQQGSDLLTYPDVKAAISAGLDQEIERLEITGERIRQNLADIANGTVADFIRVGDRGHPIIDFSGMTPEQARCLASVTVEEFVDGRSDKREVRRVKFTIADRVKANELLGRHYGLFAEEHKHTHEHHHTIIGVLLNEIDDEARGQVIEHQSDDETVPK